MAWGELLDDLCAGKYSHDSVNDKKRKKYNPCIQLFSSCPLELPMMGEKAELCILQFYNLYISSLCKHSLTVGPSQVIQGFRGVLRSAKYNLFYRILLVQTVYIFMIEAFAPHHLLEDHQKFEYSTVVSFAQFLAMMNGIVLVISFLLKTACLSNP